LFVLAEALLTGVEAARQAWNSWSAGVPWSGLLRPWTRTGSHSSLAIRPMPLPCSRTPVEPKRPRLWRSRRCCPRVPQTEGLGG